MGKSPPSGILHSPDINRSSQDTAAEGEPDGTSAAQCGGEGVGAQQGTVQYNWLSQETQMTGATAYLEKNKNKNRGHLWDGLTLTDKCQSFGFAIFPGARRPLQTSIVPYLHDGSSTRTPPHHPNGLCG